MATRKEDDIVIIDDSGSMFDEIELETLIEVHGEEEGRRIFDEFHNSDVDFTEDMPTDEEVDADLEDLLDDDVKAFEEEPALTDEEIAEKYGV